MIIKHKKLSNTGIIFETLVHTITADILSGKDSKAIPLIKKHFVKTELGKEYKLYEIISNNKNLTETKAEIVINSILENSTKINRDVLKRQKYNLIKDINENYDINTFFRIKLPNYKPYASLYTLLEIHNNNISNPSQTITNKMCLLEHLTQNKNPEKQPESELIQEFNTYDKDTRILTQKILSEKFNEKYSVFNPTQKQILREFINLVDNPIKLREFYNSKIKSLKVLLDEQVTKTKDKVIRIKLTEVDKMLKGIDKNVKLRNSDLVNLLQYSELIQELQHING